MALLDRILGVIKNAPDAASAEVALEQTLEVKGDTMAQDDLAKAYLEHNGTSPNSDPKEQCQCDKCKQYRAAK